jgi:hypothetical protein
MQHMVDLFERGDLREALRHAIPLGVKGGDALPALRGLGARDELRIQPDVTQASSAVLLEGSGFEFLRRLYRQAFERLVREERIEEAAFTLAELLRSDEEAVAFLERHGRPKLAAEIAEARGLPAGLVVRQWFLAGDRERAVAVARRRGAFADAVARLERDPARREEAASLRMIWADVLARAGNYVGAVDVAQQVPAAEKLVRAWMTRAIDVGGLAGARMLGRKLGRFPEAFDDHRDALARWSDAGDAALAAERAALAEGFCGAKPNDAIRAAARPLLRAMIADGPRSGLAASERLVGRLAQLLGDDALRVDLPAARRLPAAPLASRDVPLTISIASLDAGAIAVSDAALLPDGKILLALGELGIRLISRESRVVWEADQPASWLVLSDSGDRALAIASRGGAKRVARVDLAHRRAEAWCEASLHAWAPTFNGSMWVVSEYRSASRTSRLLVVDALADALTAIEHVELGAADTAVIALSDRECVAWTAEEFAPFDRWSWELPSWTLRRRGAIARPLGDQRFIWRGWSGSPNGSGAAWLLPFVVGEDGDEHLSETPLLVLFEGEATWTAVPGRFHGSPGGILTTDSGWVAAALTREDGVEIHLVERSSRIVRAVITLGGAKQVALRFQTFATEMLAIADDRGRVLVIDMFDGALLWNVRVA